MAKDTGRYAEFILKELTSLSPEEKQTLNRGINYGFEIKLGDLVIDSVYPWSTQAYPDRIEVLYEKNPDMKRFSDNAVNRAGKYKINKENSKSVRLTEEGDTPDSFLLEIVFNEGYDNRLSASITGTTEQTMARGIETVIDLSAPFVEIVPYSKTPLYALNAFGKKN